MLEFKPIFPDKFNDAVYNLSLYSLWDFNWNLIKFMA